jgi:hypothetical protein
LNCHHGFNLFFILASMILSFQLKTLLNSCLADSSQNCADLMID